MARRSSDGNRISAKAAPGRRWAVAVVLADRQRLYYLLSDRHQDTAGHPLEHWSPRSNDAHLFASEAQARQAASAMSVHPGVSDYEVEELRTQPPGRHRPS
jgi:hypothetical protein